MKFNYYTPMKHADWNDVAPYFHCDENWGDADQIDARLVYALYDIRRYVRKKIIIHCGYEPRPKGYHPQYLAVDFHIEGMHVVDQFLVCSRYDAFNGLGLYYWWSNPGLHGDTRPSRLNYLPESRWISTSSGVYVPLSWDNLKKAA